MAGSILMAVNSLIFTPPGSLSKAEAIAHHAAHYDPQTGQFFWNLPEEGK